MSYGGQFTERRSEVSNTGFSGVFSSLFSFISRKSIKAVDASIWEELWRQRSLVGVLVLLALYENNEY